MEEYASDGTAVPDRAELLESNILPFLLAIKTDPASLSVTSNSDSFSVYILIMTAPPLVEIEEESGTINVIISEFSRYSGSPVTIDSSDGE